MKRVGRILTAMTGSLVIAILVLAIVTRITPLPVAPIASLVEWGVQRNLGISIDIKGARLGWSLTANMFALEATSIDIVDSDGAQLTLGRAYASLSGEALWEYGKFALAEVEVESLKATLSEANLLPPGVTLFVPDIAASQGEARLSFLKRLAIRDITIGEPIAKRAQKSQLLLTHYGDHINLNANIAYQQNGQLSYILAVLKLTPGQRGHGDFILENMNPRDLGRVSTLLAPLQGIHLPITAQLSVDFNGQGEPQTGAVDLFVAPGEIVLSGTPVAFKELTVSGTADFVEQRVSLRDARFNVADVAGTLSGAMRYQMDEAGLIDQLQFDLDGRGVQARLPKLFEQVLLLPHAKAKLRYDIALGKVTIDELTAKHNFGELALDGTIGLANSDVYFDFTTQFGRMEREGLLALWPVPTAPTVKKWVTDNLTEAELVSGSLKLTAGLAELTQRKRTDPLREEALQLDLKLQRASLRFLKQLPPVQQLSADLSLRGKTFRVHGQGGVVHLPTLTDGIDQGKTRGVVLEEGRFFLANLRDPNIPAEVNFSGTGEIRDIIRALNAAPLSIAKNIDFDFDRIRGDAKAKVRLAVPLGVKADRTKFDYQVAATSLDASVDGALGPYTISKARARVDISKAGLSIVGRAKANGVAAGFAWEQPFGARAREGSRFAAQGRVSPQDMVALQQAWVGERVKGEVPAKVLVLGGLDNPTQIRVFADLTEAELMPRPLAYTKPVGLASSVQVVMGTDDEGDVDDIRARLKIDGEKDVRVQLTLDGPVVERLNLPALSLGRDRNLKVSIETRDDVRHVSFSADQFDAEKIFQTGNSELRVPSTAFEVLPFLGADAVVEGYVERLLGGHNTHVDGARVSLLRQGGLHEKLRLDGVFQDATPVTARIDRASQIRRAFSLQSQNAGNILRMFDWQDGIYGGKMEARGSLYDLRMDEEKRPREIAGRITATGFRARKVPVMASILSLASLTGISDTLTGDGIKFRKLQSDFSINDGRLKLEGGLVHGAAVGFTLQGDYDLSSDKIDIGGTVVPAYSLNSLPGKIPLLGRLLGGRRGEGVIGIGYRVSGRSDDYDVLVNPLSVLTPGVFRRIFEFGIGLPDDDTKVPEPPTEELTE
jgi:hypothetical protein